MIEKLIEIIDTYYVPDTSEYMHTIQLGKTSHNFSVRVFFFSCLTRTHFI